MSKLLFGCLALIILFQTGNGAKKFKCSYKKFDEQFSKMLMIGSRDQRFPENQTELKVFCNDYETLIPKVERYKQNCMKDTIKNIVSVLIYSIRAQVKRHCSRRTSERVRVLMDAGKCINRNADLVRNCLDTMGDHFAAIKFSPNHLKMPQICCENVKLINCFTDVMIQNGCENKLPVLLDQMHSVMGNLVDSTCGDYTIESDKCDKVPPIPKVALKIKRGFLYNLVDIFESIE